MEMKMRGLLLFITETMKPSGASNMYTDKRERKGKERRRGNGNESAV